MNSIRGLVKEVNQITRGFGSLGEDKDILISIPYVTPLPVPITIPTPAPVEGKMILLEGETTLLTSGTLIENHFQDCSPDEEFLPGKIYEFAYDVKALPLLRLEALRRAIIETFLSLKVRFEGLQVISWQLTNKRFVFQGIRKKEVAGLGSEIALSMVAIFCSGAFLIAGLILIFVGVKKLLTKFEEAAEGIPSWIIAASIFSLAGTIGYLLGRRRKK